MNRRFLTAIMFCAAMGAFAQQPAPRPAGRPAPQPLPLFFKEGWKDFSGNVPVTQDFVTNPDLLLTLYGAGKEDFGITNEGNVPHIWTGLCASSCALTLSHKDSYVDLTGKARIRWYLKTSGFHEVRPVLKLADGTFLIGDHVDAYTFDYRQSEFYLSEVRWLKLDMPKVQTKGTLLEKVDLSKVEAVGFADLTPGSGHGTGGYSDVAWIEVYGKPVKREQPASTASASEPQKGRVLGIGGLFFKSEQPGPMRQWYAKNLGLSADQGGGVTLRWREKDNPQQERATAWAIFPANSKYFEPSQLMVNYIVDDLDATIERLSTAGVKIDPKRQNESYGRFAWIYDPDGNKIELWQPIDPPK